MEEEKREKETAKEEESSYSSNYSYDEEEGKEEEDYYDYNTWIDDFVRTRQFKHWYCAVPDDFLFDNFNLFGLDKIFKNYNKALQILREEDESESESDDHGDEKSESKGSYSQVEYDTQYLYMLIHQRYIMFPDGMYEMYEKYEKGVFGTCPRVACGGQHVLPYGMSTNIGVSGTFVFCPKCKDVYIPKNRSIARMDGAAFGPNFALSFMTDTELDLKISKVKNCRIEIFGFKCNEKMRRLNREHPEIIAPTRPSDDSEYEEEEYQ